MKQTILFQRYEGAVILAASLWLYQSSGGNFWLLALLLLTPDISMLGYLHSARTGALVYNLGHSLVLPGLIALFVLAGSGSIPVLMYIWFAHIGMDRLLGYGLKESTGFKYTHLGPLGKD